jgi:hypothetical protein
MAKSPEQISGDESLTSRLRGRGVSPFWAADGGSVGCCGGTIQWRERPEATDLGETRARLIVLFINGTKIVVHGVKGRPVRRRGGTVDAEEEKKRRTVNRPPLFQPAEHDVCHRRAGPEVDATSLTWLERASGQRTGPFGGKGTDLPSDKDRKTGQWDPGLSRLDQGS